MRCRQPCFTADLFGYRIIALVSPQLFQYGRDPSLNPYFKSHSERSPFNNPVGVDNKILVLLVLPEQNDYQAYWDATFPYRIGTGIFIYGLIVLSYFLFVSLTNLSEKNAKAARLESLVRETELKMLRSQINPHFLFNSLNSISSLTITDPEKARDMVIKLSEFMRYALSRKDELPVSLSHELDNLRLYLDIEKVRFGDKLTTEEFIEPACLDFRIPVMLLQPLYENAVKHGVYESTESVWIRTEAKFSEGFCE